MAVLASDTPIPRAGRGRLWHGSIVVAAGLAAFVAAYFVVQAIGRPAPVWNGPTPTVEPLKPAVAIRQLPKSTHPLAALKVPRVVVPVRPRQVYVPVSPHVTNPPPRHTTPPPAPTVANQ